MGSWEETKKGLYREFKFRDFAAAFDFMTRVAKLAEAHQHHPLWENEWNTVRIWLSTHDAGGVVTEKDRQMALAIDTLAGQQN